MQSFLADKRGVVTGLIVMVASIFCVAMMFILTMPAAGLIWESVLPLFPSGIPAQVNQTMSLLNVVSGVTLLVLVIGCLAYGLAHATSRSPIDVQG